MEVEIVDFPLKKYLVIIRKEIKSKIKIKENKFYFNFTNERHFPISFNLIIDVEMSDEDNYSGFIDLQTVIKRNYTNFNLIIILKLKEKKINYSELFSIIQHELKHVYDYYKDSNRDTMHQMVRMDLINKTYENNKILKQFLHLMYSATIHEMDAKCSMIYEKLRYLKTYDKSEVLKQFHKSHIYDELELLNDFSYKKFISSLTKDELLIFTKNLIENFYEDDFDIYYKDFNDVVTFYSKLELYFKQLYKKYLEKAYKIIDEIILDNTTYNEVRYTTNIYYKDTNPNKIRKIIDGIFEDCGFKREKYIYIKTLQDYIRENYLSKFEEDESELEDIN